MTLRMEDIYPPDELMHGEWEPHWVCGRKDNFTIFEFVHAVEMECETGRSYFEIMNAVQSGFVSACDDQECKNWKIFGGSHWETNKGGAPVWFFR